MTSAISKVAIALGERSYDIHIGAGLLAKKAVEKGLSRKPWVKTTLGPGSKVVTDYYDKAGLTPYLDKLGFNGKELLQVIIDSVDGPAAKGRSRSDAPEIDGNVFVSSRRPLRVGDIVTVKVDQASAYDLHGTAV